MAHGVGSMKLVNVQSVLLVIIVHLVMTLTQLFLHYLACQGHTILLTTLVMSLIVCFAQPACHVRQ